VTILFCKQYFSPLNPFVRQGIRIPHSAKYSAQSHISNIIFVCGSGGGMEGCTLLMAEGVVEGEEGNILSTTTEGEQQDLTAITDEVSHMEVSTGITPVCCRIFLFFSAPHILRVHCIQCCGSVTFW
jgi:hypothetical protein